MMRDSNYYDDERFVNALTSCNELSWIAISHIGGMIVNAPADSLMIRNDGIISYTSKNYSMDLRIKLRVPVSDIADAMHSLTSLKDVQSDLIVLSDAGIFTIKAKCDGHTISMQSDNLPPWMNEFLSMIKALFEECHAEYIPIMLQDYDESEYINKIIKEKIKLEIEEYISKK